MINRLKLKDFQGHRDTEITFHPGITVITGAGNSGKTSLFRALRVLFQNHIPQLTEYWTRNVATAFEVEAEVDGNIVRRVKGSVVKEGKKAKQLVNDYQLNDEEPFQSVGREIPASILKATRIHPVKFSKDLEFDLQLQNQFEPYFLIFEGGAEKLKFLNRLSGSYIVDLAIKDVQTDLRAAKDQIEAIEAKLNDSQAEANKIAEIIGPFSILLSKVKEKHLMLVDTYDRVAKLTQLKKEFDWWQNSIDALTRSEVILNNINTEVFDFSFKRLENLRLLSSDWVYTSSALLKIDSANSIIANFDPTQLELHLARYGEMSTLAYNHTGIVNQIISVDAVMEKVTQIDWLLLENRINKLGELRYINNDYVNTLNSLADIDKDILVIDTNKQAAISTYTQNLREAAICPTCNRKITVKCVEDIVKELENE